MIKFEQQLQTKSAFCHLPFTKIIIDGYGNMFNCCYQKMSFGNILKDDILKVWQSSALREVREVTAKGELHQSCSMWRNCPYLQQEKIARPFLQYANSARPLSLEICLPHTHCNIGGENPSDENPACIMCQRNFLDSVEKHPPITALICQKVKPLMSYINEFWVLGVAEPFWKDAVFSIFKRVGFQNHSHKIKFCTNNNCTCITEKTIARFFNEVKYSDISFSLDASTPETYRKIRRIDSYDFCIKNLSNYLKARELNGGKSNHHVSIYNNINILNVNEMTGMVETAANLGVDSLIMLPTHDQSGIVKLPEIMINHRNLKIFKEESEKAKTRAQKLGVNLIYTQRFDVVPPEPNNLVQIDINSL